MFNILLQVLDDGRLTDGQGRTVDFSNTVVIMTSNHQGDLSLAFKPEFLNRIDEIVRFRALTEADLEGVVEIQLRDLEKRLAERRLVLDVTPAAKAWLAKRGYDPVFGARPLKRLIQREIADPLALALLEGRYTDGDTVTVDAPLEGVPVLSSAGLIEGGVVAGGRGSGGGGRGGGSGGSGGSRGSGDEGTLDGSGSDRLVLR